MSNAANASSTAARSYWRSSAETTPVRAAQDGVFKKCCMKTGDYDGSLRDHYF
jgi:hypothetical protein